MDPDTLTALDGNYLDAQRIFMGFSKTGEYVERQDVVIVSTGLPAERLNFGFLKPPYDDVAKSAAALRSYFGERRLPFELSYRGAAARSCVELLLSAGWRRRPDATPGLTLALPPTLPPPPRGLAIEAVRTPAQLADFRDTAFRGFGYPPAAAARFFDDRLLGLPQLRFYAGRVEGAVVATSMLVPTGEVAGIYWVATLAEARGRGYGEALTWAAIGGGRELGCRLASLQASTLGFPVYARMGFEHVLDYEFVLPPAP